MKHLWVLFDLNYKEISIESQNLANHHAEVVFFLHTACRKIRAVILDTTEGTERQYHIEIEGQYSAQLRKELKKHGFARYKWSKDGELVKI